MPDEQQRRTDPVDEDAVDEDAVDDDERPDDEGSDEGVGERAEREGIVDQQAAMLEQMQQPAPSPPPRRDD